MGLFGKILGGAAGWAMTGPLGALLGATLGNEAEERLGKKDGPGSEDTAAATGRRTGGRARAAPEDQGNLFVVAVISLLAKLARADGKVARQEVARIDEFFKAQLGLKGPDRKAAIRMFEQAKRSKDDFEDYALQIWDASGRKKNLTREVLDALMAVAAADGEWHPKEERILVRVARIFDVSEAEYAQMKALHHADRGASYSVLGLEPGATEKEVRKAYAQMAKLYHPDRIAAKDLPPPFQEFAARQFRDIQAAYDSIRAERGF